MKEIVRYLAPTEGRTPFYIKLAGKTFPDSEYQITRVDSKVAVIECVLEGEGFVEVDGETHHVKKNMVYLLNQNTSHRYYSDRCNPFTKIFLNVSGSLCETLLSSYGLSGKHFFEGEQVRELFEKIPPLVQSSLPEQRVQAALQGIFIQILCRLSLAREEKEHSEDAIIMKNFLDANIRRHVNARDLASLLYRSPDHLRKLFLREFGTTPYAYHLNRKMQMAKALLADSTLSIGEIAASLGYMDMHYFSNLFRAKCGVSPSSYRKEKRGKR